VRGRTRLSIDPRLAWTRVLADLVGGWARAMLLRESASACRECWSALMCRSLGLDSCRAQRRNPFGGATPDGAGKEHQGCPAATRPTGQAASSRQPARPASKPASPSGSRPLPRRSRNTEANATPPCGPCPRPTQLPLPHPPSPPHTHLPCAAKRRQLRLACSAGLWRCAACCGCVLLQPPACGLQCYLDPARACAPPPGPRKEQKHAHARTHTHTHTHTHRTARASGTSTTAATSMATYGARRCSPPATAA
jgi:hypothetical protein